MTVNVAPVPSVGAFQSSIDLTGNILAGGTIKTYAAGTSTPLATYSDPLGTVPNATTIDLDNNSLPSTGGIYLDITLSYKFIWFDSQGVQVDVQDNIAGDPYPIPINYTAGNDINIIDGVISLNYPRTAAEISANIIPTNNYYQPLNVLRYGAIGDGTTVDTVAIQQGISVLAELTNGELYLPAGYTFLIAQLTFSSMSNFNIRCDGILLSNAVQPGASFTDQRTTSQGLFSPLKIDTCTKFKVYGAGHINPGFVEPAFITSSSYWDWSLDCIGTGQNSTLAGFWTQFCDHFSVHDCVLDTITAQNMNDATEVYYDWLENIFFLSDTYFSVINVKSRRAGMCGFYFGSDCSQFTVVGCLAEYNSASGMQFTWSSYGTNPPTHYTVTGCVTQYNQADGFDVANTNGSETDVYACFEGCTHYYNGWINCNPSNAAGADGSGIGTFSEINEVAVANCHAYEPAQAGIYINICKQVRIVNCSVTKLNTGTQASGCEILTGTNISIIGCDIKITNTDVALAMTSGSDIVLDNCSFDGLWSVSSGTYINVCIKNSRITCYNELVTYFDIIHCNVIVSNASQNGIFTGANNLNILQNIVTATGIGIVSNTNKCQIAQNIVIAPTGVYCSAVDGNIIRGNIITSTTGAAIQLDTTCNNCEISLNKASSSSGNSILTGTSTTLTAKWNNTISGSTSYGGTFTIDF